MYFLAAYEMADCGGADREWKWAVPISAAVGGGNLPPENRKRGNGR